MLIFVFLIFSLKSTMFEQGCTWMHIWLYL